MSLFGTVQLAGNAMRAQQIGLQVVGQNIANANTPGYARAEALFAPAPTQKQGALLLGLGVQVQGIVQKVDLLLEERLRHSTSDRASSEAQSNVYSQLEQILGELSDTDLSTSLNNFLGSVNEILNQPESVSVRNLAVLQGKIFAADVQRLSSRVEQVRADVNGQIVSMAGEINRLLTDVATLNVRIATIEGTGSNSDAIGLRDQRREALTQLAEFIDIRVDEQLSGATNVYLGGDYLVFEGQSRKVSVALTPDRGLSSATLQLEGLDSALQAKAGKLAGLLAARDDILGSFLDGVDDFASAVIFEFNKVFSSGQGLKGYDSLTSERGVLNPDQPLDAAGLPFTPSNGSFKVLVKNTQTGLTRTTDINVDLNGLDGDDTTYASLVAQLNAVSGLTATVDAQGRLVLKSDSQTEQFAFADDTSGVLAALGLNTFFAGTTGRDISVNGSISSDPARFAASRSGIDGDTANAVDLAAFLDRRLESRQGDTLQTLYTNLVATVAQGSATVQAVTSGFRTFEETLHGQVLAISGVSLDEEAVRMIAFQRAYQASARFITTINELLELVVNL